MPTRSRVKLPSALCEETLRLLRERPASITIEKIADDTGIGVDWLWYFKRGKIPDPGVAKCEVLYEYLSKRKLLEPRFTHDIS